MKNIIPPAIENLSAYVPGKPIEEAAAELGLASIIKLASNENNLGPSPKALAAVRAAVGNLHRYSDADSRELKQALAARLQLPPEAVMPGNGSSEFILVLAHALLGPGLSAVMSKPSFTLYAKNAQAAGAEVREARLTPDFGHDLAALLALADSTTRLVFLDNPLNPTGAYLAPEAVLDFYRALPETAVLVLDEAYVEFVRAPRLDYEKMFRECERLVVLRTFSKIYGLAGLRAAYALMAPPLAAALNKARQPFNMNSLAQAAALAALDDEEHLRRTLEMTWRGLDYFKAELGALGLDCRPTEANFIMVGLGPDRSADEEFQRLLRRGVIVRSLSSFGLPHHLRFTAGLPEENQALVAALKDGGGFGA